MLNIVGIVAKICFVVVFFGLCILTHELGHLLAALWRGLHVERFSIGFGKRIWGFHYRGVEYIVSLLPFGGYVALPQLDPGDRPLTSDGVPLPVAKPMDRILTAVAGPAANVVFGLFLGLFIWVIGDLRPAPADHVDVWRVPQVLPLFKDGLDVDDRVVAIDGKAVTGPWSSAVNEIPADAPYVKLRVRRDGTERELVYVPVPNPEYEAGLRAGDRIVALEGRGFTQGWRELGERMILDTDELTLTVERDGRKQDITYRPVPNPDPRYDNLAYPFFEVVDPTAVGDVFPGSPADEAGLRRGDLLLAVDGETIPHVGRFVDYVAASEGRPLELLVERNGERLTFTGIEARPDQVDGETIYRIGIGISSPLVRAHPNPFSQFAEVFDRIGRTLASLTAPVVGRKSTVKPKHLSGPLGIGQLIWFKVSRFGFMGGLSFVVFITYSLAMLNLLPIPVLDGGHVVYALYELIFRRRIPTRLVVVLQNAFAVILICFMLYVTRYDIGRMLTGLKSARPQTEELQDNAAEPDKPGTEPGAEPAP